MLGIELDQKFVVPHFTFDCGGYQLMIMGLDISV